MGEIISFVNQKGGVGKTATADNLAYCFSHNKKKKTLLVDIDPSRNGTKTYCQVFKYSVKDVLADRNFDISKAIYPAKLENETIIENLFIIPSHVSLALLDGQLITMAHREKILKNQLLKIKSQFDIILLDLPPMLSIFSVNGIYASDKIIIPVKYEKDALEGIADLFKFIKEIKEEQDFVYMILKNAHDKRKKTSIKFVDDNLLDYVNAGKIFNTIISQDEEINLAKFYEVPVITYSPKSLGAHQYIKLAEEILETFLNEKKNP